MKDDNRPIPAGYEIGDMVCLISQQELKVLTAAISQINQASLDLIDLSISKGWIGLMPTLNQYEQGVKTLIAVLDQVTDNNIRLKTKYQITLK